jgi:hypothetical protein
MADERFDLTYRGTLAPGADPAQVRQRLGAAFRLGEQGIERLFSGRPVLVKRQADAATRDQYERIFAQAGAVLMIMPSEPVSHPHEAGRQSEPASVAVPGPGPADSSDRSPLTLAPQDGFLEEPPRFKMPDLDLSYLSLVPGSDWTLDDCEPPATAIPVPDISHLSLVEIDPIPDREDDN